MAQLRCPLSPTGIHHWLLDAEKFVPLRGKQARAFPGCEGRIGKCKYCAKTRIHPERLTDYGTVWTRKGDEEN